jgi:glycosyltransferase involved in cell wall biosynthesis
MVGLAKLLKQEGYEIRLVYYFPFDFYKHDLDIAGVVNCCLRHGRSKFWRIIAVARYIQQYEPDVVISFLDTPNIITSLLKAFGMRFHLIVSERNTTQHLTIKERVKFYLYKRANWIVTNSFSQETFIKTHYAKLSRKLCVITNFVDLKYFRPKQSLESCETLKIIGVGRIDPQKNIGCLIFAVKQIIDSGYKIQVDWYGRRGVTSTDLEEMIYRTGLKDIFRFHDSTLQILDKYQESELFCLPSLYEGFPNVVCEAMACGLPVICSDVCDNPSLVEHGLNGYLFDPKSPVELANCIISYILLSKEKRQQMHIVSRKMAEKKYEASIFLEKYKMLINQTY